MKEKEVKIDEAHSQVCSRGEKGGADEDRLDGIIKPKKKKTEGFVGGEMMITRDDGMGDGGERTGRLEG